MIFGKSTVEFKVGVFVFVGLVILFMFVMLIGDLKNMVSAYKLNFVFSFVNGVKIGAPVRYSGVDIGEISDLNLLPVEGRTKVLVKALIKKDIRIPVDSQIWINTLGLLGEKYVEIMPGKSSQVLAPDATVTGNDPLAMQELGEIAKSVAKKLDDGLSEIKTLAVSLNSLTKGLDEALSSIRKGEGTLGKLIYNDDIYNQLDALVSDVRKSPWKLFWKGK